MSDIAKQLFSEELIFFDYEAESYEELFKSIGKELIDLGYVKDSWPDAVLEREQEYPTGLPTEGIKIALPHTYPEHCIKPGIAVVKLRKPVMFREMGSDDGKVDAQLIFFIIGNEPAKHLKVLNQLMELFGDKDNLEALWEEARDKSTMFAAIQRRFS